MSVARHTFMERVTAFKSAVNAPILVSRDPLEVDHNNTARLLRNGLAVVGFAILEDFVRGRLKEILARVGSSNIPFDELPDPLRNAAVLGAVHALAYHGELRRRQGDDYVSFIQEHGCLIGSTRSASYKISEMALGWDRPNLSASDIKDILTTFKIRDGWGNIEALAKRVGLASPSLREDFSQAARRRHRAAHLATADTEVTHLMSFGHQAIGIALGFDALLSCSLRRLLDRDSSYLSDKGSVQEGEIRARFIDPDGTTWREIKEGSKRAVRRNSDVKALTSACLARPDARNDLVIVRDSSRQPTKWFIQSVA